MRNAECGITDYHLMAQDSLQTYTTVSALIRRSGEILLVHQFRKQDPYPNWFLPGGRLEHGELIGEGLAREVREETGLDVIEVGPLAYVTQTLDTRESTQSLAFVFEIDDWIGEVKVDDPDGVVSEARFCSLDEALALLEKMPWHSMRVPLQAYLRDEHRAGTVWMYANRGEESEQYPTFAGVLPGTILSLDQIK